MSAPDVFINCRVKVSSIFLWTITPSQLIIRKKSLFVAIHEFGKSRDGVTQYEFKVAVDASGPNWRSPPKSVFLLIRIVIYWGCFLKKAL
jgi:hypothetical protein